MSDLGDRMKGYENAFRHYLPKRMPAIVRIDGKSFHTLTRSLTKPWDRKFAGSMMEMARMLCERIQNCKLAYWQSDEVSFLLVDYERHETDAWFDNNLQKIVSVTAGMASVGFSRSFGDVGYFDARAFVLPKEEVANYFIDRQKDAIRNSIQGLGQAYFSHKFLQKLSCSEIQNKLWAEHSVSWDGQVETMFKRGACVLNNGNGWTFDVEIPVFTEDRKYVERHVFVGEER